jgi:hypothetical protein
VDWSEDRAGHFGRRAGPEKLAALTDPRVQASRAEVAKSLEGNWRPELLFVLKQEVDMYDTYQKRMAECDQRLQKHLTTFTDKGNPDQPFSTEATSKKKRAKPQKNAPQFDLSNQLQRIAGVDLTRIDGIDAMTAQTILSEVGLDMSR